MAENVLTQVHDGAGSAGLVESRAHRLLVHTCSPGARQFV